MPISPRRVYAQLRKLDQLDITTSAITRELAQDILANPEISLAMRQAIADRLHRANNQLGMQSTADEDSY
jgi:CRP-like cAMP-binding protein